MAHTTDERLARALERLQEDESLTADLQDTSAAAVRQGLEEERRGESTQDEGPFPSRVGALRRAVKEAARDYAEDPDPLIAEARGWATPRPPTTDRRPPI